MNESHTPLSDEEISAAIDGEADHTVTERLRDPSVAHRLDALTAARDLLASAPIPTLDAGVVDDLVSRAMAEAATPTNQATDASPATVTSVESIRSSRARHRSGPPTWAMAAVVTLLVAIGLGLVWSGREEPAATTRAATATTGSAPDLAGPGGGSTSSPPDFVPASIRYVGSFDSNADLRRFLVRFPDARGSTAPQRVLPSEQAVTRCANQVATIMEGEGIDPSPARQAVAQVGDTTLLVYSFRLNEPTPQATWLTSAVDPTACNPAFTFLR